MRWVWLHLARLCFRIGFFGEDTGDWCYEQYCRLKLRDEARGGVK
jgi:hypothetical protein